MFKDCEKEVVKHFSFLPFGLFYGNKNNVYMVLGATVVVFIYVEYEPIVV